MKKIFFSVLVLASQLCFAQGIEVLSNEQVPLPSGGQAYSPVISPKGDFMLVTSSDMKGLQMYDFATKQVKTITTDTGAGYDAKISDDGSTIVFRSREYKDKLRYTTLKSIDVQSGKESTLVKKSRTINGVAAVKGTAFTVNNGKMESKRLSGAKVKAPAVASIIDGQLYVTLNGKTNRISPAGTSVSYIWPSVSPDGTKVLYTVMERAKSYVCDLDGSNTVALGELSAPVWMGNNWVVGMLDHDNGEIVTSSEIVAVKADGTNRTVLTDKAEICMYPTASKDASKIVYNTASGKVFLMNVKIK